MNLPSINEITQKALNAFNRFPITISWAIVGSLICIAIVNVDGNLFSDEYSSLLQTFVLGISWFIGVRFFIEQSKNPEKWEWLKLLTLILLVLFYLHLPEFKTYDIDPKYNIRFFLYFLAGHLFAFVAPFILNWDKKAYWNYLKSMCIAIGRSALFSGVLYLGLVLALAAIQALFDVDIKPKRYGQLFIFCLGIVNTWTYLSDFPKNVLVQTTINYNKALEVFVKYILIPLVILYLIILYAYTIKIVLEWSLPKGWVSYLVIALSLLGFIIQVMINPIQKTIKSWIINKFRPWFYILLLPLVVLLFVAIFRRIGDYGITENRYFVLLIAFWILGMALFLLFSKRKQLKVLPIALCAIALLSSFGFWGAFSISKNSQLAQFQNIFQEVKTNKNMASNEQYERLRSIIDFLADRKSVQMLDEIVGLSTHEICRDTSENSRRTYDYGAANMLLDSLKIEVEPDSTINIINGEYYHYSSWNIETNTDISGYDYFTTLSLNDREEYEKEIGKYKVYYSQKRKTLSFFTIRDSKLILDVPIRPKLMHLTKHGQNLNGAPKKELELDTGNDSIMFKLMFSDLDYYITNDTIELNQARSFIFLKHK
ncbi:DUF4153 domain-containing protein [Maribacter sp. HTCC2170]|uniref:DUF4153 domain-containing protein n=1 Tax=Maribacter sp. (strain HTCC2170 / KCCM 42371) TaxID=313603 RepID=UPI00006BD5AE|nr:DUF4153 domain-containing protein [Maribacter sp. HTCC2170]